MDEIAKAVEEVKKQWSETSFQTQGHIKAIEDYDSSRDISGEKNSLPRLNGLAQDGLAMLSSLHLKLDTLAPQLPTYDEVQSAQALLENWKEQSQSLRIALRNANLQAKVNSRKTAQKERELLLGGGSESTARRRNLQTKAGMTSTAESITESLRRSRQIMAQELDRSTSTLMTFEESTGTLKKAESEYKGHRSLLMRTRNLLSTMQRQDLIDRILIFAGFLVFSLVVLYVVSKRIGILKLQRVVVASLKAGMYRGAGAGQPVADGLNVVQHDNVPPTIGANPAQNVLRDEL
ncbi:vesicle transport protein SEC20-like [Chenopodium quinoa]|uniref:vesicle transport protein SEC20-like n=1 Tax=Chenopodium quinoa TaxID=63459 RepID=UPI000B79375A|nr:vesicle transport protein SEC20-like [Chenopodium quinoa]XP_021721543.1 vesicle transport protein SEC20-like [Chenopodium quinoa]XP_021721544.1 vesicle transport protein SEC20-like [Chenopodium quinoa]